MKYTVILFLLLSFTVSAKEFKKIINYLEESVDVSAAADKYGDYSFSLNVSHTLNDEWRVFGELDTNNYYELGVGYSFLVFDLYNEVSFKITETVLDYPKPHLGLFTAGYLYEFIWFTHLEVGYGSASRKRAGDILSTELDYHSVSLDKSVGVLYEVSHWLDVGYSFNHDGNHQKASLYVINERERRFKTTYLYHDLSLTLNLWGVKPSITYTFGELEYLEFGLSFDF